ncbi:hypothetical protein P148_SR1C00001G0151 [candidate division SR1 bacterium RAAC1_SR1_1]|nr:hypothetical protein P148_SR1C00001G0151 [candidate division SR1 bacterium RAAC1_SR1_1]
MSDFPKQYKQTKIDSYSSLSSQHHPFFFLPEQYTNAFDIQQIFRLFLLDTIHTIRYGEPLSGGFFLPDPLHDTKEKSHTSLSFLKKQLKQFGLSNLIPGLQIPQDFAFAFSLQQFFAEHLRKGTLFEDRFLVYRSPKHQTPVASDLVEHISNKKNRYTIKYFVSTKNHSLDVMTESPETIFGDVAIAIHPQHKKAKQLKGQEAIIPIINKTIPIIIDERADFTRYGGVYRVTPGHDKLGLAIAKDHNLPIDTYAIDKDGYFTENAGLFAKKSVEEFFSNIIQSLSDIGNLTNTESFTGTIPVCQQSKEHLIFRSWKGFFVKIPDEAIESFFNQAIISSTGITRDYIDNSYRIASAHQKTGVPVPLRSNTKGTFILDANRLQEAYKTVGIKQGLALGLFILHCISNHLLPPTFSAEEFITMIFDTHDQVSFTQLFSLIGIIYPQTKKEFDVLEKAIQNLDKEKSLEKNVSQLLDILDDAFCLEKGAHEKYHFAFEKFDPDMKDIQQYQQVISYDFSTIAMLLQEAEKTDINQLLTFCSKQDALKIAIKNILFAQYNLGHSFLEAIHVLPSLKNEKDSNNLPVAELSITKSYHPDCIRVSLLSLADSEKTYDSQIFTEWDQSISKFWNACRYIKTTFFDGSKAINYKKIQQNLEKNISTFSAFDGRIISKLTKLVEEYQQLQSPKQIGTFVHNVFDFIHQDFSSKYLELIKSAPSEHSSNICLCIVETIVSFLHPYLPILTNELGNIFGFEKNIDSNGFLKAFASIQKNYSISLFMEIIDRFSTMKIGLGLKKHDVVGLFIRSNQDFIKFARSNESLFKKTLHAEDVIYLVHHEEVPCGYKKEDIIDISIGIKAMSKPSISGILLLQKQLQEKEEYMQHLKHLVQELNTSGADNSIIQQKKDEISKIKQEIELLNFEISKCKMKD